ncbi:MAG: molybdate ABC transporter substrate-binding protein [Eggerthellaceae bacterium]|nr:molybdate ABC transporter substrate-binding protein [Eggerthellaceae bacterium]
MKMKMKALIVGVVAFALVCGVALAGCQKHENATLQIFAANSLSEAMNEAQAAYTKSHDWITFADTQYKGSGTLVKELQGGASADILITAATSNMDDAAGSGLIDESSRFDLYKNDLVVIVKKGSDIKVASLNDVLDKKVAIGNESVPAGNYARQSLASIGAYTDASGKGGDYVGISNDNLLIAESVGQVVTYVATGDAEVGIAYLSDVYRNSDVEVAFTIPADAHKDIIYPAAVCKDSKAASEAAAFLKWCHEDSAAKQIWQKYGFALA